MRPPWSCNGGPHDGGIAGEAPALDTAAGATLVTLLRQAPRQPYRIYSEEEFLAAEDWQVDAEPGYGSEPGPAYDVEPEFALLGQHRPRAPRPWGSLAALAALTSAVVAVVGVVALNATRSQPPSDRRFAGGIVDRGSSSLEIAADRPSVRRLGASPRKSTRRVSVLARRIAGRVGRTPTAAHPHRPSQPVSPTTSAPTAASTPATPTPATPSTAAPTTAAATPAATAPATPASAAASTPVAANTATAPTPTARRADAEFGFERR
jgi:hypothetical protein